MSGSKVFKGFVWSPFSQLGTLPFIEYLLDRIFKIVKVGGCKKLFC